MSYRTFVIANPTAAAGEVGREWDYIERMLRTRLPEMDAAFTEGPGHATLLTRQALRAGWEMVVCVGGDGTVNEVLNGFYEPPDATEWYARRDGWLEPTRTAETPTPVTEDAVLGLVPLGTGGDFRRTIGLMGGLRESIEHLTGDRTRRIDIGEAACVDDDNKVTARYFLNIASAGFSGAVDTEVNTMWKGFGGRLSFVLASAKAFAKWKNVDLEVRLDDKIELSGATFNLVIANGEYFGGGMWVAPGADLEDGQFQIVEFGDLTKWEMATAMPGIYRGHHLRQHKVKRHHATRVSARATDGDDSVLLDLDGEVPGTLPAHWRMHPGALRLKV
jgi:diacylglycerol kinase family enzyme